jgi:hypothetical protein
MASRISDRISASTAVVARISGRHCPRAEGETRRRSIRPPDRFIRPLSVADLKRLLSSGQEAVAGVA